MIPGWCQVINIHCNHFVGAEYRRAGAGENDCSRKGCGKEGDILGPDSLRNRDDAALDWIGLH